MRVGATLSIALVLLALVPGPAASAEAGEEACALSGVEPERFWTYAVTRHHNETLNTTSRVRVELTETVSTSEGPALRFVRTEYGDAYTARTTELRRARDLHLLQAVTNYSWDGEEGPGWSEKRLRYAPALPLAPCDLSPGETESARGSMHLTSSVTVNGTTAGPFGHTLEYDRDQEVLRTQIVHVPAGSFLAAVVRTSDSGGEGHSEQWTAFNASVGLPLEEQVRDRSGALREHWRLLDWGRRAPDLHVVNGTLAAAATEEGWLLRLVVGNAGDGDAEAFTVRVRNATGVVLGELEVHRPARAHTALDLHLALPEAAANGSLTLALEDVRPAETSAADNRLTFSLEDAAAAVGADGHLMLVPEAVELYPGAFGVPGLRLAVRNAGDGDVEAFNVTVARPGEPPFLEAPGEFMWAGRELPLDLPLEGIGRPRPAELVVTVLAGDVRVLHAELTLPWTLREEPPQADPGTGSGLPPDAGATPPEPPANAGEPDDGGLEPGERPGGHGEPARPLGPEGDSAPLAGTPGPNAALILLGLALAATGRPR